MLKNNFQFSVRGTRNTQLDRVGYHQGENWTFAYILDGLVETTPHFVDCVDRNFKRAFKTIERRQSLNSIRDLAINAIIKNVVNEGKASIALLICVDGKVLTLTVGDTRVYFLNERTRTIDHSRAQELISSGKLNESLLNQNSFRKYLTKSVCKDMAEVELDERIHNQVPEGSKFIICSDGFWSSFDDDEEIYNFNSKTLEAYLSALSIENLSDNTSVMLLKKE
ncbi:conserved hypothetical protein [Alteromonas sp. 38]|uniref:PP2C family protein-serine/threonine phosphatase n=1 Tax=Alteromonas TaxID=226 RepID=UPI0012F1F5A7|nr:MULTISPECIES: hypothetical protein [Alteromonas]CAD5290304.1 conserved hypothetical protein [Alteromonas sp. 154]VXB25229.1 conserved hypothetical protein [Alteromonas sp. 38]